MHRMVTVLGFLAAIGICGSSRLDAGENYALLVAVGDYDIKELRPLKFTRSDVLEFQKALLESGFPAKNIVLMHDDLKALLSHYEKLGDGRDPKNFLPLRANIAKQLELLLGRLRPDDSVIVAMSGHGVQFKGDKRSYFCPSDSRLDQKESLVAFEDVFNALKDCAAGRKLFLVDACQNDPLSAISRSRQSVDLESVTRPQTEAVPEGIIALFSCKAGQKSFELPELGHGVFFYHLLDGWKGKGDLNGDGRLSYQELAAYTEKQTADYAANKLQVLQTPQLKAEFSGEWILKSLTRSNAEYRPLFNGTDLSGWTVASGPRSSWRIERNELVVDGIVDNPGWLMTDRDYSDYTLRFEFQLASGGNSGLAVHAAPSDTKFPEIQILDDNFAKYAPFPNSMKTGAIHRMTNSKGARLKPTGDWNRMQVDVRGRAINISVNGDVVTSTAFGLLTATPEMPALNRSSGRIALQSWHGGTVRFRKIEILEHGFTPIFNGRDLTGWKVDTGDRSVWSVQSGELVANSTPQTRGWLFTEKDYADFALRFEFQATQGSNSGISFRGAHGEGDSLPGSTKLPEIQLQDDSYEPFARQPDQFKTGSLFAFGLSRRATLAPLGNWNDGEIEVRGPELRVTINGTLVNSLQLNDLGSEAAAIPGLRRTSGKIGLQSWLGTFRFRNLRVKALDGK